METEPTVEIREKSSSMASRRSAGIKLSLEAQANIVSVSGRTIEATITIGQAVVKALELIEIEGIAAPYSERTVTVTLPKGYKATICAGVLYVDLDTYLDFEVIDYNNL